MTEDREWEAEGLPTSPHALISLKANKAMTCGKRRRERECECRGCNYRFGKRSLGSGLGWIKFRSGKVWTTQILFGFGFGLD